MSFFSSVGLSERPAIAVSDIRPVMGVIDNTIHPPKAESWDQQVAAQLARAEQQKAEKKAQEASLAAQEAAQRAREAQVVVYTPRPVATPTGSCMDWMAMAGITDTANAYNVIMRESGCNPNAVNRSSGACGIGQQLPCGKWAHQWNDPVGGMIDMQNYVFGRYGSWANARAWWDAHNWY